MNTYKSTITSAMRKPIQLLGIIPCASLVVLLALFSIAFIRAGTLDQNPSDQLIQHASEQHARALQLSIDTLTLDRAVRNQEWDRVEPALTDLVNTHNLWLSSYENLRTQQANTYRAPNDPESIADYYTRLNYIYGDLSQALKELQIVGQSVVRRAPFIDASSESRLDAAVESFQKHHPQFDRLSAEILALYQLRSEQAAGTNSASVRRSLVLILACTLFATLFGFIPRINRLNSKVSTLESKNQSQSQSQSQISVPQENAHDSTLESGFQTPHESTHEQQDQHRKAA